MSKGYPRLQFLCFSPTYTNWCTLSLHHTFLVSGLIEEHSNLRQQIQSLRQEHQDLEWQASMSKGYLKLEFYICFNPTYTYWCYSHLTFLISGLIEENSNLRQQLQSLRQEHQDLERQASRSKGYLEQQVQAMEAQTEEQIAAAKRLEEEARLRAEDLQRQVEAAKKMQTSHKQFLEVSFSHPFKRHFDFPFG